MCCVWMLRSIDSRNAMPVATVTHRTISTFIIRWANRSGHRHTHKKQNLFSFANTVNGQLANGVIAFGKFELCDALEHDKTQPDEFYWWQWWRRWWWWWCDIFAKNIISLSLSDTHQFDPRHLTTLSQLSMHSRASAIRMNWHSQPPISHSLVRSLWNRKPKVIPLSVSQSQCVWHCWATRCSGISLMSAMPFLRPLWLAILFCVYGPYGRDDDDTPRTITFYGIIFS